MSYELTYNSNVSDPATLVPTIIISVVAAIFGIVVMWKIFTKAGKPGWASIVPFYNLYVFFEITWGNGWLFLLLFLSIIPIVGTIAVLVICIITMVKLAKVFGKGGGFAVGLIFLSVIFEAILAFGSSKYVGIDGAKAQEPVPTNVDPAATPEVPTATEEETTTNEENNI